MAMGQFKFLCMYVCMLFLLLLCCLDIIVHFIILFWLSYLDNWMVSIGPSVPLLTTLQLAKV